MYQLGGLVSNTVKSFRNFLRAQISCFLYISALSTGPASATYRLPGGLPQFPPVASLLRKGAPCPESGLPKSRMQPGYSFLEPIAITVGRESSVFSRSVANSAH